MTALITAAEANAWADHVKLSIDTLDGELEAAQAVEVLSRIGTTYAVSGWIDSNTTPSLVRKIIAMKYVGWFFQRTYSEDSEASNYGLLLVAQAENLIDGIVAGTLSLPGAISVDGSVIGSPAFYPNDESSALSPTPDDRSLGPNSFSMGQVW